MATIKQVERQIEKIEAFEVTFRHIDRGRDVRGDRGAIPSYPYERALKNKANVKKWIETRFQPNYLGFDVDIHTRDGSRAHGRTLLGTVRDTYLHDY